MGGGGNYKLLNLFDDNLMIGVSDGENGIVCHDMWL